MAIGQIAFVDYLEAKYGVDSRSINLRVREALRKRIEPRESLTVLDVGCGTGASLRRLAEISSSHIDYTGLDRLANNRAAGYEATKAWAIGEGFEVESRDDEIVARTGNRTIVCRFATGDLFTPPDRIEKTSFDLITAHALLDMLPLSAAIVAIRSLLSPEGLLYSAINYDGRTTLVPLLYSEELNDFEGRLLLAYDRSMDSRMINGLVVGGSRTGTTLHEVLLGSGFNVAAFGASDWSICPVEGAYETGERLFIEAIIRMIGAEGERHSETAGPELAEWFAERIGHISTRRLGLIAHQTDILGVLE